jgi:hypothetical protein
VHARGSGAYGHFTPHESLAEYTTAEFRTGTGRATRRTCPPDGARAPRGGAGWIGGRARSGGRERSRRAGSAAWPHSAKYVWATSQVPRYPS